MMHLKIRLDIAGWMAAGKPGIAEWQSVTSDVMKLQSCELKAPVPGADDLAAMRYFFQRMIQSRKGELISCDPLPGMTLPTVRIVSKYHAGRGHAMTFVASLAVVAEALLVELLITGTEDNFTGTREAMVTHELLKTAGASEKEQLAKNVFPIEWKFDRYQPGSRTSGLAYVLSDDEKYDAAYPNHPLTRVRRSLRRIERTFQVTATPMGNGINIEMVPLTPMGFEEIVRELGPQVAKDAIMEAAMKKAGVGFPALEVRQKMYRDQRDEEVKKNFENFQAEQAKLASFVEAGKKLAQESTAEGTMLILARDQATGNWHTLRERDATALAMFDSRSFFDDFVESRELACDPEVVSVKELFSRFAELKSRGIDAISINRCPRCTDPREVLPLAAIQDEPNFLLRCATIMAVQRILVEEKLQAALAESDLVKRKAGLMHIVWHMDPGNARVHLEIGKMAAEERDAALFKYSKGKLARYAPELLASLPEMPG
jgi:hypothetical protein